jgi:hypothetical protein
MKNDFPISFGPTYGQFVWLVAADNNYNTQPSGAGKGCMIFFLF